MAVHGIGYIGDTTDGSGDDGGLFASIFGDGSGLAADVQQAQEDIANAVYGAASTVDPTSVDPNAPDGPGGLVPTSDGGGSGVLQVPETTIYGEPGNPDAPAQIAFMPDGTAIVSGKDQNVTYPATPVSVQDVPALSSSQQAQIDQLMAPASPTASLPAEQAPLQAGLVPSGIDPKKLVIGGLALAAGWFFFLR